MTYCAPLKHYLWWQHVPQPAGRRRRPRRHTLRRRLRRLRRTRAVGAVDDGVLRRAMGCRARRARRLPEPLDQRGRHDPATGLLRRRLLLGAEGHRDPRWRRAHVGCASAGPESLVDLETTHEITTNHSCLEIVRMGDIARERVCTSRDGRRHLVDCPGGRWHSARYRPDRTRRGARIPDPSGVRGRRAERAEACGLAGGSAVP